MWINCCDLLYCFYSSISLLLLLFVFIHRDLFCAIELNEFCERVLIWFGIGIECVCMCKTVPLSITHIKSTHNQTNKSKAVAHNGLTLHLIFCEFVFFFLSFFFFHFTISSSSLLLCTQINICFGWKRREKKLRKTNSSFCKNRFFETIFFCWMKNFFYRSIEYYFRFFLRSNHIIFIFCCFENREREERTREIRPSPIEFPHTHSRVLTSVAFFWESESDHFSVVKKAIIFQ